MTHSELAIDEMNKDTQKDMVSCKKYDCMMDVKGSCSVCADCSEYSVEKNILKCEWVE